MSTSSSNRALLLLAAGAAAISFAPILVKGLVTSGMAPTPAALWRVLLGAVLLLGFGFARGWAHKLPRAVRSTVLIGGFFFALDLWVWHWSIVYVGAGVATILGNTQVFWTAALGRVLYGERLSGRFAIGAALAFAGVVLLAGVGSHVSWDREYVLGIALGLATGFVYAVYILALRRGNQLWSEEAAAGDDGDSLGATARASVILGWTLAIGSVCLLVIASAEGQVEPPSDGVDILYLVGLAVGVQILGWLAISQGLPRVAAARGSLVLLLQPALAAGWGALFFAESLEPLQLAGAALTLMGVYLGSRRS